MALPRQLRETFRRPGAVASASGTATICYFAAHVRAVPIAAQPQLGPRPLERPRAADLAASLSIESRFTHLPRRYDCLPLHRIIYRRPRQFQRTFIVVPQAVRRLVLLQRAAEVVLAVNHHPAVAVLDPFQERRHLAQLGLRPGAV